MAFKKKDEDIWAELDTIASGGGSDEDTWRELENIANIETGLTTSQEKGLAASEEKLAGLPTFGAGRERAAAGRTRAKLKMKGKAALAQTEDVPVDVQSGADAWTRLGLAFRPTPKDKVQYLSEKYGAENLTQRDGQFFIRQKTEDGKAYDLRIDEPEFTPNDIADMAGAAPDVFGAIAAAAVLKNPTGVMARIGQLVAPSVAGSALGGATDVAMRSIDGTDIDAQEILERRGTDAMIGIAMDSAFVGGLTGIRKYNLSRKDANQELTKALGDLGEEVDMSLAVRTGSEKLAEIEGYVRKASIFGSSLDKVYKRTAEGLQRIQNMVMNPDTYKVDEQALRDTYQKAFAEDSNEVIEGLWAKNKKAALILHKDLKRQMDYHFGGQPVKDFSDMAGDIRLRASATLDNNKASAGQLYDRFKESLAETGEPTFNAKEFAKIVDRTYVGDIRDHAKGIIGGFLQSTSAKFQKAALAKTKGRPVVNQYGEVQRIKPPVDLTFSELDAFNKRLKSKLVFNKQGDPQNDALKKLSTSLDRTLTRMISGDQYSKSRGLRDAANSYWKKKVLPFRTPDMRGLFLQATDAGFVKDTSLLNKLTQEGGEFAKELKNTLPVEDYEVIKRAWLSKQLETQGAIPDNLGSVQVDSALKALSSIRSDTLENVLGKEGVTGFRKLKDTFAMAGVMKGKMSYDQYLELGTVRTHKEAMGLAKEIRDVNAEIVRAEKSFHEGITKPVMKGEMEPGYLNRGQFFSHSYEKLNGKQFKNLVAKMSPAQKEDFSMGVINKTLADAGKGAKTAAEQILTERGNIPLVNSEQLFRILRRDSEKLQSILTKDQYKNLFNFNTVLRNITETTAKGAGSGNLAAQATKAQLLMGEGSKTGFGTLSKMAKLAFYSAILKSNKAGQFINSAMAKAGPVSQAEFNNLTTRTIIDSQVLRNLASELSHSPRLESEIAEYLKGIGQGIQDKEKEQDEK